MYEGSKIQLSKEAEKHVYYRDQDSDIIIMLGDCLEIMKEFPDKSFDSIISDPPYGIDFCSSWTSRKERLENDKLSDWDILIKSFSPEFKRVITDIGCCCCCCGGGGKTPVAALFTIEAIKHFNLIQTLVWKKFIGLGWRYRPSYENIVVLSKDGNNYAFYDETKKCSNVIEGINQDIPQYNGDKAGYSDEHPTQKPVDLMKRLINTHTKVNNLILEPFMGGGSTLIAAKELKRRAVGIEISEKYCAMATQRLKNTIVPMF